MAIFPNLYYSMSLSARSSEAWEQLGVSTGYPLPSLISNPIVTLLPIPKIFNGNFIHGYFLIGLLILVLKQCWYALLKYICQLYKVLLPILSCPVQHFFSATQSNSLQALIREVASTLKTDMICANNPFLCKEVHTSVKPLMHE